MEDFNVLTLNAWGLLYISKDIDKRMNAIGDELAKGEYDLVFLQEVWSETHYIIICEKVKDVLPHGHYFHSGFLGSGCATLSRYPIVDTFFYKYSHNGYFWDLFHCDWFAGKGVSCATINHPKKKIYTFNTHLHADDPKKNCAGVDESRTLQCYQLAQCVSQTTRPGDAIILSGDMNHTPNSLGIKAIVTLTALWDTYETASNKPSECFTVDKEFNKYLAASEITSRLDYIFSSNAFECVSCNLAIKKIPNSDLHFSDHNGYRATLRFKNADKVTKTLERSDSMEVQRILLQLYDVMKMGEKLSSEMNWMKTLPICIAFVVLVLLPLFSIDTFHLFFPSVSSWCGKGVFLLQIICSVFCSVYLWTITYHRMTDVKEFRAVSYEIDSKLRSMEGTNEAKVKSNSHASK